MRSAPFRGRLALLAALVWLGLPAATSAHVVHADLNGDGIHDVVDVAARPSEVPVRTHSRHSQRLQASDRIIRVAIADIDRDGDPDLVASTSRLGLRIWINNGRGRFVRREEGRPFRTWRTVRSAFEAARAGTTADAQCDSDATLLPPDLPGRGITEPGTRVRHASRAPMVRFAFSPTSPRAPPSLS